MSGIALALIFHDNREVPEFVISEEDLSVLLTLPAVGWAGEHPDFEREQVDNRYV